ncbi:hypothetical protein [Candidatus Phytoplasma pini]|uniref:Sequence-variable mosaic (SVM) signal sequence domain-containing protein n=1 Tax=Candidatus Phytoplasma pini TaxID=267362 RepID=A0A559KJL4_9MOLU|nr:hypothetical protein [Candidatus Phytoplasma pini]TVY12310.1 hypothetical protein MDPP_00190 [Candidatus Phytoplasma pini]
MLKLKIKFVLFNIFLVLWFIIYDKNVIAMKKQNFYIDKKSTNTIVDLFNLLTKKKQLEEKIHYLRNKTKNKLNFDNSREIIKLEHDNIELKQKISEIQKIISNDLKKVTFNLKPLIKIID